MKILQQCIYFPPEVGGLESHAYYLCRELVRMGHDVVIVTSRSQPSVLSSEVIDGIQVVRTWFPSRSPIGWATHSFASVPQYLPLAKRSDVLHAQTFASAPPGMLAKAIYRKPLVLTLHTSHFLRLAKKKAWRPVLARIIRSADWLLAASEEIRDVALDIYPHQRAESLTNGVDTEMFCAVEPTLPRQNGYRLIVPRRLFEKNGVEYFVRAMPLLRKQADVEAVIVGDGPLRQRLESLADDLGVSAHVRFVGARPNSEMPALLSSADIAVIPSLMEATSVAALEAMSCERPVAASRVGGLPEIVDDEVGTLFEPADPADLARHVLALLGRDDLARMGAAARRRVIEHWSLKRLAQRHVEIYRELLDEAQ